MIDVVQAGIKLQPKYWPLSARYLLNFVSIFVCLNTGVSNASGLYLGYDNFEYQTVIDGINLDYVPTGPALGGSLDVGESSYLQIMYGKYDDVIDLDDNGSSSFDSTLKGIGFGSNFQDWRVYGSYTVTKDQLRAGHGRDLEFLSTSDIESSVYELNSSYQWVTGGWATTALAGLQYAKVDLDALLDQSSARTTMSSDSLYINGRASGDYYFSMGSNSGFYLGASVSWYERLSESRTDTTLSLNMSEGGLPLPPPPPPSPAPDPMPMSNSDQGSDSRNPPPPLNNGGGGGGGGNGGNGGNRQANNNGSNNLTNNRTFGSSFGLLGIYGVYDINEHWSLDWNSTFGFAGEGNFDAHSLTLNYYF